MIYTVDVSLTLAVIYGLFAFFGVVGAAAAAENGDAYIAFGALAFAFFFGLTAYVLGVA